MLLVGRAGGGMGHIHVFPFDSWSLPPWGDLWSVALDDRSGRAACPWRHFGATKKDLCRAGYSQEKVECIGLWWLVCWLRLSVKSGLKLPRKVEDCYPLLSIRLANTYELISFRKIIFLKWFERLKINCSWMSHAPWACWLFWVGLVNRSESHLEGSSLSVSIAFIVHSNCLAYFFILEPAVALQEATASPCWICSSNRESTHPTSRRDCLKDKKIVLGYFTWLA